MTMTIGTITECYARKSVTQKEKEMLIFVSSDYFIVVSLYTYVNI